MTRPRDPQTPAEWQLAVDAADACLALDAARQYGLVTGGPEVDDRRAAWILAQGKLRGIEPRPDAIKNFLAQLIRQDLAPAPDPPAPIATSGDSGSTVAEVADCGLHVAGDCACGYWHMPDTSVLIGKPLTDGV
jgi:hypothetical protein